MTSTGSPLAQEYADKAAEIARRLKPGTYDSVQALASVSIAHSLARIADVLEQRPA